MNDEVPAVSLDDVGSRYTHLAELLEMWEIGIEILDEKIRNMAYSAGSGMPDKLQKLEAAAETLRGTMDGMSNRSDYRWKLADQINAIPEYPTVAEGGRGTPLKVEKFFKRP
jgi:hypothetical protein